MLLQLSQFTWVFPYAALHQDPTTPSGHPHTDVCVHGSCIYILCCTSHPRDYSVTTKLYHWIHSPFFPIPQHPSIWQPSKCSLYNYWFYFCSACLFYFVSFLGSIIDNIYLLPFYCSYFLFSSLRRSFNISYNIGLVMMYSFSLLLSGKLFIGPSIIHDTFAG